MVNDDEINYVTDVDGEWSLLGGNRNWLVMFDTKDEGKKL